MLNMTIGDQIVNISFTNENTAEYIRAGSVKSEVTKGTWQGVEGIEMNFLLTKSQLSQNSNFPPLLVRIVSVHSA